ncbi:MAG: DUF1801 domain-containing protein [Mangrovibacterium sp.]
MNELKTKPSQQSVTEFVNRIEPEQKRVDSIQLLGLIQSLTGENPVLWGDSIVGFGSYHYKSVSGREGDWFRIGFSPRKQNFSLYLSLCDIQTEMADELKQLGKHKTGKSCIYFNKLADINLSVLKEMIVKAAIGRK